MFAYYPPSGSTFYAKFSYLAYSWIFTRYTLQQTQENQWHMEQNAQMMQRGGLRGSPGGRGRGFGGGRGGPTGRGRGGGPPGKLLHRAHFMI